MATRMISLLDSEALLHVIRFLSGLRPCDVDVRRGFLMDMLLFGTVVFMCENGI